MTLKPVSVPAWLLALVTAVGAQSRRGGLPDRRVSDCQQDPRSWHPSGELIATGGVYDEQGKERYGVFALRGSDDWRTATVTGRAYDERCASTSAVREGEIYKVYLPFESLGGGTPPPEEFEITRVVSEEDGGR